MVLLATPALADVCDDLWFTRNLIMDRAGYCFGSTLGQAVFDNANCRGKEVKLDTASQKLVEDLRRNETDLSCAVNTKGTTLDLPDIEIRRRLVDLPVRDEFESGCIGWRDGDVPLFAGHQPGSEVIGWVSPGDNILYSHVPVGDWDYVTVSDSNWNLKAGGWFGQATTDASCENWAG